jgi:hypothetical protein
VKGPTGREDGMDLIGLLILCLDDVIQETGSGN